MVHVDAPLTHAFAIHTGHRQGSGTVAPDAALALTPLGHAVLCALREAEEDGS